MSDKIVTDVPDQHRFEIRSGGDLAGFAEYRRDGDRYVFTHTEIDDAFEGQGMGSALAKGALETVRAAGHKAVPICPFIAGWIDKHPDFADLVDHEALARARD